MPDKQGTDRGRHPLTRRAILEAGIALADCEGLAAVTMRRLGSELGVEAMALYRHVSNKQDVLDGMAALLVAAMTPVVVPDGAPWQEVLRELSWQYRRVITEHPAVFTGQAQRPIVLGEDHSAIDRVLSTLQAAGFTRELALDLYLVGSSFARGFALSEMGQGQGPLQLPADADQDRAFSRGLDVIIAGFEDLHATS